jgi:uncharacterized protein YigE (DUF2233 family)
MKLVLLMAAISGGICRGEVREEAVTFAGTQFRVVKLEPQQVGLVWKGGDGKPYQTFDRVQARFSKEGRTVRFLMNAGLYAPGYSPCGLHVENGIEMKPLNQAEGRGNFHLQPNGVLLIHGVSGTSKPNAEIQTTAARVAFLKDMALHASYISRLRLAVQSGPMLLIDGKRHPTFQEGSPNKLHRNGVGIDPNGRIVFAITAAGQVVNFWDFAGLFQSLGCRNALFLDGTISQMAVNPKGPIESNSFAAMFVVAE